MKKLSLLFMCALMSVYAGGRTIDLTSLPASGSTYGMKSFIDGDTITGTLRGQLYPYQLFIANNATVYLKNVTIYGYDDARYPFAGLTCNGNAHIVLIGTNYVKGFYQNYPGIQASTNTNQTLRISGTGSLDVRCGGTENPNTGVLQGYAAAIGGSFNDNCGDIVIEGGTINAYSGSASAAIGGGSYHECGMITISGGNITTHPGSNNSTGIGASFHGECDKITISGGTIYAEGNGHGAAIGGNEQSTTYGIEITSGLVYITALNESYNPSTGFGAPYTIGKGLNGTGGTVKIAGISLGDGIAENPFVYPQPCTAPTNVNVTNVTKNSAKIAWTSASIIDSKWDIAYKADGDLGETHNIVTTNPYTLTGLSEGKDYTVRVRTACGTSSYSNYSSNVSFSTPCPIPTNLRVPAATITSSTASVNWDGTSDKYFIEWGIVGETTTRGMVVSAKNTLLSELQPSTNYRVRVKSKCNETTFSDFTSWVNFTTASESNPCYTPGLQIMNVTSTSARLVWSYNSGMTFVDIAKANENFPNGRWVYDDYYDATGLEPNTQYKARVTAKCGDDVYSDASEIVYFTTLPDETPIECKQPKYLRYEDVTATSFKVTWTPGGTETKWYCRVMYRDQSGALYSGWANSPEKIFTDLDPMTDYTVTIEASCGDGVFSDQSFLYVTTSPSAEGVEEVTPSDSPSKGEKILRDGQLLILVGDKTYDARGIEIKK